MAAWAEETHRGSAQVSKDGTVTLTRTFRFNTDVPGSRPAWAVALINIYKYDAHPDDLTCLAIEVNSTPLEALGWFDVTYTYSNRPFDIGTTSTTANGGEPGSNDPTVVADPTIRTPVVKWGTNKRSIPFTKDWTPGGRKAVQNSAKQPIEGLEIEECTTTITVSLNKGLIDITAKQNSFQNKVNDANFKIIPAHGGYARGTLRCNSWTGSYQFESGYGWYTACEVEFEYKSTGWKMEILDQGFYERKLVNTVYVEQKFINTVTGMPVDSPVKLNGGGGKLADGDPDVYLTFYPHEEVSFTNVFA